MNPWKHFSDALADHIRATVAPCSMSLAEAARVDVVVYRQDDLYSMAEALTAKASGLGVIIAGLGGRNPDPKSKALLMGGNFSISVWADPTSVSDLKADDLCWLCAAEAHGFVVTPGPNDLTRRLEIQDVCITPDKKFLIWEAKGFVKRLPAS